MPATLSIVMPVFNHPEELKAMLDSILANSFHDWELLAVDDGSEIETLSVLEKYAEKDKRIHFIRREREPKGAQTCRNIGLEAAQGKFIIFFDSDDYIAPYCLQQRVDEIQAHPELDFMVFRSGLYYDNEFRKQPNILNFGYDFHQDDIVAFCARNLPFIVWNNIYRCEALRKHNISWDTKLLSLQDAQFNLECLLAGLRYSYSECPPDYGYRTTSTNSVSKQLRSPAHQDSNIYATERFYQLVRNKYGNHYDGSLLLGAYYLYVTASCSGHHKDYNLRLASCVRKYLPFRGIIFTIQMYLVSFFSYFLPLNIARRIPTIGYHIRNKIWEMKKVRQLQRLYNKN